MNIERGDRRNSMWATAGAFLTANWMWLLFAWTFGIAMILVVLWGGKEVLQGARWQMKILIAAASILALALPMGIFTWRIWLDFRRR